MGDKKSKIHVTTDKNDAILFVLNKHAIRQIKDGEKVKVDLTIGGSRKTFYLLRDKSLARSMKGSNDLD